MVKRKNPYKPFNDASKDIEPEESKLKDPLELNPPIKKDNTQFVPKPPSFALGGTSGNGVRGTLGYKEQWSAAERVAASPEIDVTKVGSDTNLWTDGEITKMEGYRFMAKVNDERSADGIGGGNITKLQIWKDDRPIAAYDRGWKQQPETAEQKRAVEVIRNVFDEPKREFTKIVPPNKDKEHDIDR